jgi:hypothetical protein
VTRYAHEKEREAAVIKEMNGKNLNVASSASRASAR